MGNTPTELNPKLSNDFCVLPATDKFASTDCTVRLETASFTSVWTKYEITLILVPEPYSAQY